MTLSNHQILLCFAADFLVAVGYFTAAYYVQFRRERKREIQAESQERQAKLEAFWKEEQLRLNPRVVLVGRLPPVEKHPEWDSFKQESCHTQRRLKLEHDRLRMEDLNRKMMHTSNRDEDISRQLEELKDFWK